MLIFVLAGEAYSLWDFLVVILFKVMVFWLYGTVLKLYAANIDVACSFLRERGETRESRGLARDFG